MRLFAYALLPLLLASPVQAVELRIISPGIVYNAALSELVDDYNKKSGNTVLIVRATMDKLINQAKTDTPAADVVGLPADLMNTLYLDGGIVGATYTPLGRGELGLAVKKGAPKPDISNLAAVKATLRNAKSIASVDPKQGSVGGAVLLALDKMGMRKEIEPKIKWMPGGGDVQRSVAAGQDEIAFGPYLSDMRNPGIDVVGALPPAAATPVEITGFLSTTVKDRAAAKSLIDYLRSADAAPEWRKAKAFPVQ